MERGGVAAGAVRFHVMLHGRYWVGRGCTAPDHPPGVMLPLSSLMRTTNTWGPSHLPFTVSCANTVHTCVRSTSSSQHSTRSYCEMLALHPATAFHQANIVYGAPA